MIIFRFDRNVCSRNELIHLSQFLEEKLGEKNFIIIPKDIDVLLDAKAKDLYQIRDDIEMVICEMSKKKPKRRNKSE